MVKCLIIGSGGMIGIKFLGVLVRLQELGVLSDLEEISSASIGSLIGLFYIFHRGDLSKVIKTVFDIEIKNYTKTNIKNLLYKYGLIDTTKLQEKIIELLGTDLSFQELYEIYPIKFYVSSYEVISDKTLYMSVDKTPELSVVRAVLRSISIPFVFVPEMTGTQIFLDGSTVEENPYEPFLKFAPDEVLEIRVSESLSTTTTEHKTPKTLFGYLVMILQRLLRNGRVGFDNFKRINVDYTSSEILNFGASYEEKLKMYTEGYSTRVVY
jgi:predicted acylesterase/phospholipase RssA